MRVAGWLGLVVVLLVGVCACGGDGDEESGGGSGASSVEIDADAQERAEAVVLQLSDFPSGWRASAADKDEAGAEKLRECIGVDYSKLTRTGDAESQDFAKGESEISSTAAVFADEGQAETWMDEYQRGMSGSGTEDCLQATVEDSVNEASKGHSESKVGEVEAGQLSFTQPADVDEAFAWQIVVPVEITSGEGAGLSPNAYVEFVVLREGDTAAVVQTSDVLTEFDPVLRDQLVGKVAGRMTAPNS